MLSVAAFATTGCVSTAAPTASTESPSPSAVASHPPTPSADGEPPHLVIDFTGVGPWLLGGAIDDAAGEPVGYEPGYQEACPWVHEFTRPDAPAILLPDPADSGMIEQIVVRGWGQAQDLAAESPRTVAGIGIGSTLDELRAAYADLQEVPGKYAPHYSVENEVGSWMNFAVTDAGIVDAVVVRASPSIDSEYCG